MNPPGGPDLGPSSVLDRVKMFLPQLAQANLELEKQIAGEGSESVVIDSTILAEGGDSDEEVEEEAGNKDTESTQTKNQKGPMIKIDFALGDFDQHPIALAEDEKDNNESTTDTQAKSCTKMEEEEDSDDDEDRSKRKVVDSIFRVDKQK